MPAHHLINPHRLIEVAKQMLALEIEARQDMVILDLAPSLSDWTIKKSHWKSLHGFANGHQKLGTGRVYTTPIMSIDTDLRWVRTFNTLYRLETPADDVVRLLLSSTH